MIIIFAGTIGRFPVGGHAWADMQYLVGLRSLGHEVIYLEECGEESWVYNWHTEHLTTDLAYPTTYVRDCLESIGFAGQWIYRAGAKWAGMCPSHFENVCREADLLLIRGAPLGGWRDEYQLPARRCFVDVDPGFTQIKLVNGDKGLMETVERCEHLFTIGQRLGAADCPIPTAGRTWVKTVSPVSLSHWPDAGADDGGPFSTVMQWRSYKEVYLGGVGYGNKEKEFPKYMDLPLRTPQRLLLALTGASPQPFLDNGWQVIEGWSRSWTPADYRGFISQSRAEFCVAKHGYAATRGGWFSDRSICYLASGRPALVQDTGLGDWLPTGRGVVTFRNPEQALQGIDGINRDYETHRRAAREIAEQLFDARRVLPPLLEAAVG